MADQKKYVNILSKKAISDNVEAQQIIASLNIVPDKEGQTITASGVIAGYSPINVAGVNADVDSNIQPENIREGVDILGITGTLVEINPETITVNPKKTQQIITPTSPHTGLTEVTINAVTSNIDSNIQAENIKNGVSILGVAGNVIESNETTLNITPTTSAQRIIPESPYTGFDEINVTAVTSAIDNNIQSGNIKSGVNILGVQGSVVELNGETISITPTTSQQVIEPTSPKNAITEVTVNAVTSSIDNNIQPNNIREGVSILGVTGTAECPEYYRSFQVTNNVLVANTQINKIVKLDGVKKISAYALAYAYYDNSGLSGKIDMSGIEELPYAASCYYCFYFCRNITEVDLSSLQSIAGSSACYGMFYNSSLQKADLSSLTTISGANACAQMFRACGNLTEVNLSSLQTIGSAYINYTCSYMFSGCIKLKSIDLSSLTTINSNSYSACEYMFDGCSELETVDMSGIATVSAKSAFYYMFNNCVKLKQVDLSSLSSASNSGVFVGMFSGCSELTNVDLSSLTSLPSQEMCSSMFAHCSSLTTIPFSNLTSITGSSAFQNAFWNCTSLANVSFDSLSVITGSGCFYRCFRDCTSLATLSFPALTSTSFGSYVNQFYDMLYGVTGCVVHFPSNLQSVIGSWASVTNGFGGTNTIVLFDLTATE